VKSNYSDVQKDNNKHRIKSILSEIDFEFIESQTDFLSPDFDFIEAYIADFDLNIRPRGWNGWSLSCPLVVMADADYKNIKKEEEIIRDFLKNNINYVLLFNNKAVFAVDLQFLIIINLSDSRYEFFYITKTGLSREKSDLRDFREKVLAEESYVYKDLIENLKTNGSDKLDVFLNKSVFSGFEKSFGGESNFEINKRVVDDSVTHTDHTNDPKLNFDLIAEQIVQFAGAIPQREVLELPFYERIRWWRSWGACKHHWLGSPAPGPAPREDELPLLSFGIYGPWGSGKSTLIKPIKLKFEERDHFVAVINPWKWDGKGDIHDFVRASVLHSATSGPLRTKRSALNRRIWFRENRLLVFAFISVLLIVAALMLVGAVRPALLETLQTGWNWAISGAGVVAVLSAFWQFFGNGISQALGGLVFGREPETFGATALAQAYRDIATLMREARRIEGNSLGKPMIVIFDDLDRCTPDRVAEFIESVHSLVSAGAIVFVACDEEYVAAALSVKHGGVSKYLSEERRINFGRNFLEKIIQVPIFMPTLDPDGLADIGITTRTVEEDQQSVDLTERSENKNHESALVHRDAVSVNKYGTADARDATVDTQQPKPETVAETKLTQINHEVLNRATVPLGLNVRQAKALSNTLKLYLGIQREMELRDPIDGGFTEQEARRVAAFLLADRYDRGWLDAWYMERRPVEDMSKPDPLRDGPIARDDDLRNFVTDSFDEDRNLIKPLYALVGRRPGG
jgi:hypothetical protein